MMIEEMTLIMTYWMTKACTVWSELTLASYLSIS